MRPLPRRWLIAGAVGVTATVTAAVVGLVVVADRGCDGPVQATYHGRYVLIDGSAPPTTAYSSRLVITPTGTC